MVRLSQLVNFFSDSQWDGFYGILTNVEKDLKGDDNTIMLGGGDDTVYVKGSNNNITSGSDNDTITIHANSNDTLVSGGAGTNTVRFEGTAGDYSTSYDGSGNLVYSKGGQVVATLIKNTVQNIKFF